MNSFHFIDFFDPRRLDYGKVAGTFFREQLNERQGTPTYQSNTSTTYDQLYIVVLGEDKYTKIPIQFVPEFLTLNTQADLTEIKPILRNLPIYQYTGGKNQLSLELDIYAEREDRTDVIERCKQLESLRYSDGYTNPKQQIILVWGDLFNGEKWEVSGVNIKYSEFKQRQNSLPQRANVTLTLLQVSDENLTFADILRS